MGKVILTDVDGTLIPYHDTEPPLSVLEAVDRLHEHGHKVFMVTGRTLAHVNGRLAEIPFDGMIGGNGAFITMDGRLVKQSCIPDDDVRRILAWLDKRHLEYFVETVDGQLGSSGFETRAVQTLEEYGLQPPVVVREVYPQMQFPKKLNPEHVTKVNYILERYDDYVQMSAAFPWLKCSTWGGTGESALFGDVAQDGIDKLVAVQELLQMLGATREDAIGFGDAKVDIPLFEACGTSVCMGDGRAAAKEAATYVTDAAADDGWLHACERLGLI